MTLHWPSHRPLVLVAMLGDAAATYYCGHRRGRSRKDSSPDISRALFIVESTLTSSSSSALDVVEIKVLSSKAFFIVESSLVIILDVGCTVGKRPHRIVESVLRQDGCSVMLEIVLFTVI